MRWDNINKILAQLLPSVVNRLPGSLCSSVSDDEPITVLSHLNLRSPFLHCYCRCLSFTSPRSLRTPFTRISFSPYGP